MGVRLTGISTPIGGLEWEYTDKKEIITPYPIVPDRKIQVFISSICGDNGKYDNVRLKLKSAIEETKLADVYTFEGKDASTLTAEAHYTLALENCDVCIFLIDNADGIRQGVQDEIDTAKRCNIKSLYYFCDETQKEMTSLQQSLIGAKYAKSKTVHTFDELSLDGAHALVNDIVTVFSYYCRGYLTINSKENALDLQTVELGKNAIYHASAMPKAVIEKIDKCTDYILRFTLGFSVEGSKGDHIETSEIDGWAEQFLSIMFEGKSIKNFNTGMFLETIKEQQDVAFFNIVEIRWKAIQSYFLDDVKRCVEYLNEALALAKETDQPTWIIQDILIDLRNQQLLLDRINNRFTEPPAQKELNESKERVYYPALDRIHDSLHEKYISDLYKKKTESPYTVTFGNNFDQYGSLLASSFVISFYNGSLTHLLIFYDRIRDFLFYLCSQYDDWRFRKDLLKLAIFGGKESDVKGIINAYPEVLNKMSAKDAAEIMSFCDNHAVMHQRFRSQLIAFGAIGYYLDDKEYCKRKSEIITKIKTWLNEDKSVVENGQHIFKCLTDVAYRISQDDLAEICCLFMEKHYSRWFTDLFKFMANRIKLNKMEERVAQNLIHHIIAVLDNENERKQVEYQANFLYILRKQNREITNLLDEKVHEYFPDFYHGIYKLETTHEPQTDFPEYIQKCIKRINESNDSQGENGCYFGHGTRDIATIRNILLADENVCDISTIDEAISAVADTLLVSKEEIDVKLDAISFMICIAIRYPKECSRNKDVFDRILQAKQSIEDIDNTFMSSNIDKIALRIALALLKTAVDEDGYVDFLEGVSYIQNDKATILSVARIITEYLEIDEGVVLPKMIGVVVMQNVLQWLQIDNLDIKWRATRILLMLSRDPENEVIVNQRIISLIDNDNVFIKNLILRQIYTTKGIHERTRQYVISKCHQDPCSVVRMVCKEVEDKQMSEN